jgi:hypothetical protein
MYECGSHEDITGDNESYQSSNHGLKKNFSCEIRLRMLSGKHPYSNCLKNGSVFDISITHPSTTVVIK